VLVIRRAYEPRLQIHFLDGIPHVASTTAAAEMTAIALGVVVGAAPDASPAVHFWLLATVCLVGGRGAVHLVQTRARRAGSAVRPCLIVGAGRVGHLTARRLLERPELGLRPVGFLDKEPLEVGEDSSGLAVLGASWDFDRIVVEHGVRHVIITFSTAPYHVLLNITRRCWELGVPVSLVPRLFEVEGKRISAEHLGGLPLVAVETADPKGWQFKVKYAIDRIVAGAALLVLAPLMIAIAVAVRTSGRPVFYRQLRVGRDGRAFVMLKFRTMAGRPEDAGEADLDWAMTQVHGRGNGHALATVVPITAAARATDRRTSVGRLLRRFSLDELPQLINILRGDMSLVGPRPERVDYVDQFQGAVYRYGDRHRVKSGITGWAQVNGLRGKTSLADRVEWDNHYVENWSAWLDVKVVLMTIACVVRGHSEDL
jgi:exopolysaccharide biosynthesis polyprenyl glycosylphosphotransferase